MTENEIITKVKAIMNEIGEETSLTLLAQDTVRITEYIQSAIPDAVAYVQLHSPVRCVNKKEYTGSSTLSADSDGFIRIVLPDDYVQLIAVKLSSWKRVANIAYSYGTQEYYAQANEYTRSGDYKPVVVEGYKLVTSGGSTTGKKTLELTSSATSPTLEMLLYEGKYVSADTGDVLPLSLTDPIALAVCYMTASLVYSYFENKTTADEMQRIALTLIPQE